MNKSIRKLRFEEALTRLDAIVEAMESGEIGVEDSIARYEEAMHLAAHCRRILDAAEQRIQKIQLDAAGRAELTDFDVPEGTGPDDASADDDAVGDEGRDPTGADEPCPPDAPPAPRT